MPPSYPPQRDDESDTDYQIRRNKFCDKYIAPHCTFNTDGSIKDPSFKPVIFAFFLVIIIPIIIILAQ